MDKLTAKNEDGSNAYELGDIDEVNKFIDEIEDVRLGSPRTQAREDDDLRLHETYVHRTLREETPGTTFSADQIRAAAFPSDFKVLTKQIEESIIWVFNNSTPSAERSENETEYSTVEGYCVSMLFWSEHIYGQRGVERPRQDILKHDITQVKEWLKHKHRSAAMETKNIGQSKEELTQSPGSETASSQNIEVLGSSTAAEQREEHGEAEPDDGRHDEDLEGGNSAAGETAKPKKAKRKLADVNYEFTEMPELPSAVPSNDPRIVFGAHEMPSELPGTVSMTPQDVLQYFEDHPIPGTKIVTPQHVLQYFAANPISGTERASPNAWLAAQRAALGYSGPGPVHTTVTGSAELLHDLGGSVEDDAIVGGRNESLDKSMMESAADLPAGGEDDNNDDEESILGMEDLEEEDE